MARGSQQRQLVSETESGSDDESTVVVKPATTSSGRPDRAAKNKAKEAWGPLVPASRAPEGTRNKSGKGKKSSKKKKSKADSGSDIDIGQLLDKDSPQHQSRRYCAPDMENPLTDSDDESPAARKVNQSPSDSKDGQPEEGDAQNAPANKSSRTKASPPIARKEATSKGHYGSSSSEESTGSQESSDDEDGSEKSGLEELENSPRALQKTFDAEIAAFADDSDDHGGAGQVSLPKARAANVVAYDSDDDSIQASQPIEDIPRPTKRSRIVIVSDSDSETAPAPPRKKSKDIRKTIDGSSRNQDTNDRAYDKHKHAASTTTTPRSGHGSKSRHATATSDKHAKDTIKRGSSAATKGKESKSLAGTPKPGKPSKKRSKANEDIAWAELSDSVPAVKRARTIHHDGTSKKRPSASIEDSNSDCDPDSIELVIPPDGRLGLKEQHERVRTVVRLAIKSLEDDACLVNAFPDADDTEHDFVHIALTHAAKEVGDKDMYKRLRPKEKNLYWKKLSPLVSQRVSNLRGNIKKATVGQVGTAYGLRRNDAKKAAWLLKGQRFIYPHSYANDTVDGTEPYGRPIFGDVLANTLFQTTRSNGSRIIDRFTSSLSNLPNEKEIPAAMLALVATVIHACIDDYGRPRNQAVSFEGPTFIGIYRKHISILSDLKAERLGKYHSVMHRLFLDATSTAIEDVEDEVSFLNLKDMADQ